VLRGTLQKHDNLVNFAEHHKAQLLESSSSGLGSSSDPSLSSTPRKKASTGRSKFAHFCVIVHMMIHCSATATGYHIGWLVTTGMCFHCFFCDILFEDYDQNQLVVV
jgi:hypothetical protein